MKFCSTYACLQFKRRRKIVNLGPQTNAVHFFGKIRDEYHSSDADRITDKKLSLNLPRSELHQRLYTFQRRKIVAKTMKFVFDTGTTPNITGNEKPIAL